MLAELYSYKVYYVVYTNVSMLKITIIDKMQGKVGYLLFCFYGMYMYMLC